MSTGPTQNYGDDTATTWRARPVLAALVRTTASCAPLLLALAVGAAAARWVPAARIGVPPELWLVAVVALSTGVLLVLTQWLRRLVPLSALLRLSLVLPDRVPHRFQVARRTWSPESLTATGGPDAAHGGAADRLLALVGALAAHDARTRTHGERVQAYAALIGRELGLSREDVDRLSWAALLHDVGKVHVPVDIINKNGRPSAQEWAALQEHPCHGGRLVQPLRSWLGPWLDGVEQHHERWDGGGYPLGLRGEEVSLSARIIAVADTYDAITSARSYKKPMSAEQARQEITRCAGAQFDPVVVRAFLSVGIGRLRLVAGPATLLAALPGVGALPAQALSGASAVAQTVGGQLATVMVSAGVGVGVGLTATQALAAPPADLAVVEVADVTSTGTPEGAVGGLVADRGTEGAAATALPGASAPVDSGGATAPSAPAAAEALAGEVVPEEAGVPAPSDPATSGPGAAGSSGGASVAPGAASRPAVPSSAPAADRGAAARSADAGGGAPAADPTRTTTGPGPTTPAPTTPAPKMPTPTTSAPTAPVPSAPAPTAGEAEAERVKKEKAVKDLAEAAARAAKDEAAKEKAAKELAEAAAKAEKEKEKAEKEKAEKAAKDAAAAAKAAKDQVEKVMIPTS